MLNLRQSDLYRNLMALAAGEAFYFADFQHDDGSTLRIFNYRLASYTDFLQPDALECRGHMFHVDNEGNAVELLSWPPEKFFNYCENNFTMDLDLSQVDEVYDKLDGSLISTYTLGDVLMLKSKGSISSEQAVDAMSWLKEHPVFLEALRGATINGYTVNCEWVSPLNRIVIGYIEPSLKVLSARSRLDGSYVSYTQLVDTFDAHNVVKQVDVSDPVAFVASVPDMLGDIEGFVVKLKSGQRFKVKTNKYLSLHHAKDSVNNPRRLFECILEEGIDDLRSMFHTDAVAIMMIDQMQIKVDHLFNAMVKEVEGFFDVNKDLSRKDYAIKAKTEVTEMFFSRAMNKYLGKDPEYKDFLKKRYKSFGVMDTSVSAE